jgi:hypothetical protein
MTLKTTDGFWRSFDRDHEALPKHSDKLDSLKTTQSNGPSAKGFTCGTCGMPAHLECWKIDAGIDVSEPGSIESEFLQGTDKIPVPALSFGRRTQNVWVPRHGPAPYSSNMWKEELRGTTPVIELPDATVMVDVSQGKRHLPVKGTEQKRGGSIVYANVLCASVTGLHWKLDLGDCWHAEPCKLCLENPSQI